MNILNIKEFEKTCGKMMPLRRDMSVFDGDEFACACGQSHTFYSGATSVMYEGVSGRFIVRCPNDFMTLSLIKTKMKFGLIYQGMEYLAGHKVSEAY